MFDFRPVGHAVIRPTGKLPIWNSPPLGRKRAYYLIPDDWPVFLVRVAGLTANPASTESPGDVRDGFSRIDPLDGLPALVC
jgi:hypothetical protein